MATIWYFDTIDSDGILAGAPAYLTSNDGYLHVWNAGPALLVANLTSASSPSPPTDGLPVPVGAWTVLPADEAEGSERIAFAPILGADGIIPAEDNWAGMRLWTA
jgi:hypothetical protein